MNYDPLKLPLLVLSSGCAGFYIGSRYVGGLAQPTYMLEKPAWMIQAQQTMSVMLALTAVTALAWLFIDYTTYEG